MAEDAAAEYLAFEGYRLVERNWRCRRGEVDIIAAEGNCLCFIEVKYRSGTGFGTPAEGVTASKRKRLARLAEIFLADGKYEDYDIRFDVAEVSPSGVHLIRDAFRAPED